jgi:hypothetical protein
MRVTVRVGEGEGIRVWVGGWDTSLVTLTHPLSPIILYI